MGMFASSAVIYGLLTTWRTTSRKRSSNHPGQFPGNQPRYSPANSESGGKHGVGLYIPAPGEDTVKYAAGRDRWRNRHGELEMGRKDRSTRRSKLVLSVGAATMVAIAMFAAEAKAQTPGEGLSNMEASVEPLRPGVTENQLLAELAAHNEQRKADLH